MRLPTCHPRSSSWKSSSSEAKAGGSQLSVACEEAMKFHGDLHRERLSLGCVCSQEEESCRGSR